MIRNFKLLVEYDGTNYCGWQRQENGPTIQGELERVIGIILQQQVNVIGAGRTDAGVHARRQAANFRIDAQSDPDTIRSGLNGLLPEDIVVHEVVEVPYEFHARFSAKERLYSYVITREPTALRRSYTWHLRYPMKLDQMRWAAASIIGEHDFSSFCKANADVEHHRCTVFTARWDEEGPLVTFTIRADRFLHGMVRALVGTMVDVGRGHTKIEDFLKILERKDRSEAGQAAPAKGLILEEIVY